MSWLLQEFRNAIRGIGKRPAFSALIVGVLGAGLACVIFMLSLYNGFVLRPLPFAQPEQLVQIGFHEDGGSSEVAPVNNQDLIGIRRHLSASADVAGVARSTINLSDLDRPERTNGAHVSANLFQVLGVAPILGRDFSSADEQPGSPAVAMLSWALWQSRYGGDAGIVGKQIRVDAQPATVIGVMPKDFSYPRTERVWVPATLAEGARLDGYSYRVVARRHPGVDAVSIANAFDSWFADAARGEPERFRGQGPQVEPLASMATDGTTRGMLRVMFAAAIMVLLIACANAANLLLARTMGRHQEFFVRIALGAGRRQLARHLMVESLILCLLAGVLALLLAGIAVSWQQDLLRQSETFPLWLRFDIDGTVAVGALVAALLTALITGVLPAFRVNDMTVASGLRDGARSTGGGLFTRASRALVIGEIALSCVLLICLGTLVRGVLALDRVDLGIDTRNLLTARVALSTNAYPTAADQLRLYERLAERLRADPGVVSATVGTALPGTYYNEIHDVLPEGIAAHDAALPQVYSGAVDANFLAAYGARLEQGRFFDSRDRGDSAHVAVVDRNFAERHGEGASVLGRQFRLDPRNPDGTVVTIIGVIAPLTLNSPGYATQPAMLVPLSQNVFRVASIAVRTRGDALGFGPHLEQLMRDIDADAPLYWMRDYPAVIRSMTVGERIVAKDFAVFGVIALILAAAGLYGVMAYAVAQRTREIGVRRALGASGVRVLGLVLGRSLLQLALGLAIGVMAGVSLALELTGSLERMGSPEPGVVLGAVGVLLAAAVLAVLVPARHALRIDPMEALRHE